jgi:hypothetical protein
MAYLFSTPKEEKKYILPKYYDDDVVDTNDAIGEDETDRLLAESYDDEMMDDAGAVGTKKNNVTSALSPTPLVLYVLVVVLPVVVIFVFVYYWKTKEAKKEPKQITGDDDVKAVPVEQPGEKPVPQAPVPVEQPGEVPVPQAPVVVPEVNPKSNYYVSALSELRRKVAEGEQELLGKSEATPDDDANTEYKQLKSLLEKINRCNSSYQARLQQIIEQDDDDVNLPEYRIPKYRNLLGMLKPLVDDRLSVLLNGTTDDPAVGELTSLRTDILQHWTLINSLESSNILQRVHAKDHVRRVRRAKYD